MKYIDRKGNITIEENEQDKFLRHLYNDRGGRLCLKLLIRPFVSKAAGVLLNTRLSARFVPDFVKNNKIDLSIYEKQNFSSWNDFFIRRIRKEERPIDMRENILILAPVTENFPYTGSAQTHVSASKIQNIQ